MRKSHPKPKNHEDFEILCLKLLRTYWKCEQLELYSSLGGTQHGVDMIDLSGVERLRAAQCKLHEEGKAITGDEIRKEVEKASAFAPPLGLYLILTTAKGNKEAHDTVIAVNREHREKGLFEVQFWAWNRIEELLDQYTEIRDQYEGGFSAIEVARVRMQLEDIQVQVASRTAEDKEDQFHSEIDEARDYINSGELQLAKLLLNRIQSRHETQLNARHKFRILTNLAAVAIGDSDWNKAADLYLEAKSFQPTDEMAQVNEALAYAFLEQRQRSFELANKLKDVYPNSERLFGILVRTAPKEMSLSEIEGMVPTHIAIKGEAAISLGYRASETGVLSLAERYFRAATQSHPSWSVPWLLLGMAILDKETTETWKKYGFDQIRCDQARLAEAETALNTSLLLARKEKSKRNIVEALVYSSRIKAVLGKEAESQRHIDEALSIAPDDTNVVTFQAQSLRIQGNAKDSIESLRRVPVLQLSHHGRMMLALLLMERGGFGDYRDAAEICVALAKVAEPMKPDFREHVTAVAIEALAKQDRIAEGHSLINELPEKTLSDTGIKTLRAKLYKLEDKQELASAEADKSLETVSRTTSPHDIRRLATLLSDMGRHKDALALWQQVTITSVPSSDVHKLLECASRLGRHDVMLDTFQALRTAGAVEPDLLEHELRLLEGYDTASAIDIMRQEVVKNPANRNLRLRLSYLGLALDRPDLVDQDLSSIPSVDEISPSSGLRAVQVMRASGHVRESIEYAYELLRRHFDSIHAHRAILAALGPFDPDPDIKKPDSAEPGSAICYVEDGESTPRWVILEDSVNPDQKLGELPPDHFIYQQMLHKQIGEMFILAEGVQQRTAYIKEILSKYVYRYQDCMSQWQVRFPDSRDVQMVRLESKMDEFGKQALDIGTIEKSVTELHENVKALEQIYQSEKVPLHLFGGHLGKNAFESLRHLVYASDVTIKCCFGNIEERMESSKAFRDATTIIVDMSAISTLFTLGRLDVLENWPMNIVISQSTDNELRQMIANEARMHSHEVGRLAKTEDGIGFIKFEAGKKESYVEELRKLVSVLETKCSVRPCRALAALEPAKREIMTRCFGNYGAETIVLASMPGAVLWTDDHIQAIFARGENGVLRVWTQLVIGERTNSGAIDPECYNEASARLAGFEYFFTSINPQILRVSAMIANWQIGSWPFSQGLKVFDSQFIDFAAGMQLAAGFLKVLYAEPLLPETQNAVTVQILEYVARRNKGLTAIRVLRNALPRVFGLNVVGAAKAVQTFDAWLATR